LKTIQKTIQIIESPKPLDQLIESEVERKACIGKVMTYTLRNLTEKFVDSGFQWLLPVALSQSTDPLWPDPGASIDKRIEVDIYGKPVRATTSMIVHKLIASSIAYPKTLHLVAQHTVLRRLNAQKQVKHIYEFTQLDFEARGATSKRHIRTSRRRLNRFNNQPKHDMKSELTALCRCDTLQVPKKSFKIYDKEDLEAEYGVDWEAELSATIDNPVWITNIPENSTTSKTSKQANGINYDYFYHNLVKCSQEQKREWEHSKNP